MPDKNKKSRWDYLGKEPEKEMELLIEKSPKPASKILFYRIGDFQPTGIMVVNADGTELKQILPWGNSPKWSPDGRKIAFSGYPGESKSGEIFSRDVLMDADFSIEIYLMKPDGTNIRRLTLSKQMGSDRPVWSPDGLKIAFLRTRESISQIWLMNSDGTNQGQLTYDGNHLIFPWTPDGKIVFLKYPEAHSPASWIGTLDPKSGRIERLPIFENGDTDPVWSPDMKAIAFCRGKDIYVMNTDGAELRQIAEGMVPSWSPDGNWIAFSSRKRSKWGAEIFIIRKDGKCERRLTDTTPPRPDKEVDDWDPCWLPK